jgi:pilin
MSTAPHDNVRGRWFLGGRRRAPSPDRASGIATIELIAIIAITLLMIALAVAAYRTYSMRQEVRAGLAAVAQVQSLVVDAFARTGVPPLSEQEVPALASSAPHRYIEAVAIDHGRIEIRFGNDAGKALSGRSLYVTPFETMDGEVFWLCGNRRPGVGLYPLGLFDGAAPPAPLPTTVEPRYLPAECR